MSSPRCNAELCRELKILLSSDEMLSEFVRTTNP